MRPDADFFARVGPIEYTGGPFRHEPGWYVEDVTGLNSGASANPDEQPRDQGEGQHDLPNRLDDARSISMRGFAYARSMYDLGRMARQQGALLALPQQFGPYTWHEFGEWFTVDVRRGPSWDFRRDGDSGFADFTVRFRAPSQKFYGLTHASGTGVTVLVENLGTVPTAPTIAVTGNMPAGYTVQGPGGRLYQVLSGIGPGTTDVIDMRGDGILLRNGTPAVGVYGQRIDTWTVPAAGTAAQTLFANAGSGQMKVTAPPAFM